MEHMMLRKGDMVRPMIRRYRYKGSNLAIVNIVVERWLSRNEDLGLPRPVRKGYGAKPCLERVIWSSGVQQTSRANKFSASSWRTKSKIQSGFWFIFWATESQSPSEPSGSNWYQGETKDESVYFQCW
jgi:hypothetical protein